MPNLYFVDKKYGNMFLLSALCDEVCSFLDKTLVTLRSVSATGRPSVPLVKRRTSVCTYKTALYSKFITN